MTDRATGSDVTPKGIPLGVCMGNRKLRNIRPSGAFWQEVTLWNITHSDRKSRDPFGLRLEEMGARIRNQGCEEKEKRILFPKK
jgi:hypothetical protein